MNKKAAFLLGAALCLFVTATTYLFTGYLSAGAKDGSIPSPAHSPKGNYVKFYVYQGVPMNIYEWISTGTGFKLDPKRLER